MADQITVAVGADHAGFVLKNELAAGLAKSGFLIHDLGTTSADSVDYPDYAVKVAEEVTSGKAKYGLLVCGTGIGMSITANKVHGIRAALCHTEFEGRVGRLHNDANVVCFGQRIIGAELALEIAKIFLTTEFEGGRHAKRIDKIRAVEAKR